MRIDQSLAKIVQGLTDDLTKLKDLQRIGSDGVQTFRVHTDFITIDTDPSNPTAFLKMFRIKFTPADNNLKSGLAFRMVAVQKRTFGSTVTLINQSDTFDRKPVQGDNIQVWEPNTSILIFGGDGREMKFYCFTTSEGAISIEYV